MKKSKYITLIILVLILAIACKKKKHEPAPAPEQLLTASDWYPEKYGESVFTSCYKRTTYRFSTNGKLDRHKYSIGAGDECAMDEHDTGTWRLLNNGKELQMQFGGGPHVFKIVRISSTELLLHGSWSSPDVDFLLDKTPH